MSTSALEETVKKLSGHQKLILRMPKFRIEYDHRDVIKHLERLGLHKIFDEHQCDFGNLFSKVGTYWNDYPHSTS